MQHDMLCITKFAYKYSSNSAINNMKSFTLFIRKKKDFYKGITNISQQDVLSQAFL